MAHMFGGRRTIGRFPRVINTNSRSLMSANRMRMLFVLAFMALAMPAAAQTGSITGRVTDESGRAIVGARVQAVDGFRTLATAQTDDTGGFRLANLPPGTYAITATRIGYRLTR